MFDHLKTEKTTQLDIGAKYSNDKTNAWVSAYIGRVDDFILFRYNPHNSRQSQVENVNAMIMGEKWASPISSVMRGKRMQVSLILGGKPQ